MISQVIAHRPFERRMKRHKRSSAWTQVLAAMNSRENLKHRITLEGLKQKYHSTLNEFKHMDAEDRKATGSRDQGQYSAKAKACFELLELIKEDEKKSNLVTVGAAKAKEKDLENGKLYQQKLAHGPKRKMSASSIEDYPDDEPMDEEGMPLGWRDGASPSPHQLLVKSGKSDLTNVASILGKAKEKLAEIPTREVKLQQSDNERLLL